MGLISREAAIEAVAEEWNWCCGEYPASQIINETQCAIDRVASAPAVPMDMLCEWLADYAAPPANASNEKALENHETRALIWRHFWEKMMEE